MWAGTLNYLRNSTKDRMSNSLSIDIFPLKEFSGLPGGEKLLSFLLVVFPGSK